MEDLIADLNTFMQEHVMWAAPILGLITFGESMVFIGAFFPATILMVTAGGLIGAGEGEVVRAVIKSLLRLAVVGDIPPLRLGQGLEVILKAVLPHAEDGQVAGGRRQRQHVDIDVRHRGLQRIHRVGRLPELAQHALLIRRDVQ